MEILGLIPARGGSKSIPRKNIVSLAGRPLLTYTCDAALSSRTLTRVVLSTDDGEIAAVGQDCGVEVPFLRPVELAQDDTPTLPVIQHALHWLEEHQSYCPEIIVLLQPTSPLRRAEHIDDAVDLLLETGADSVVSMVEVPHQFNPVSVMKMDQAGQLAPYIEGQGTRILRRQEKPRVYARNGPAVCALWTRTLNLYGNPFGPRSVGYVMSSLDSIDIDDEEDLFICEAILRSNRFLPRGG